MRLAGLLAALLLASPALSQPITARSDDGRLFSLAPDGTWRELPAGDGFVEIRLSGLEDNFDGGCMLSFTLSNGTQRGFEDYAPKLFFADKAGRVVGKAIVGTETDDFRPGAVAVMTGWTEGKVGCGQLSAVWVSGFEYSCADDPADCRSVLAIKPDERLPMVLR